jgi:hypothetical protein
MKRILRVWRWAGSRRRFLGWMGGIAAGSLALPWLPRRGAAPDRSMKEAEFYRPSDREE